MEDKEIVISPEAVKYEGPVVVPNTNAATVPQGTDAERLIAMAIDKNVPVETLEKLLTMRRELKAEAAKEAYFQALKAFQAELPVIEKTKGVKNKSGNIVYKYAPLDSIVTQVRGFLAKHGFSYNITTAQAEGKLTASCVSHHIAGHSETTSIEVPVGSDYMTAQQEVGSARTFSMRYAFCNAFGIMTGDEDDDGNAPGRPEKKNGSGYARPKGGVVPPAQTPPENREEIRAEIEMVIDHVLFPQDVRASAKKYIARADADLGKALRMAKGVLDKAIKDAANAEPRVEGDTGQLGDDDMSITNAPEMTEQELGDEEAEIPPKRSGPQGQEMFGESPYHHGG